MIEVKYRNAESLATVPIATVDILNVEAVFDLVSECGIYDGDDRMTEFEGQFVTENGKPVYFEIVGMS